MGTALGSPPVSTPFPPSVPRTRSPTGLILWQNASTGMWGRSNEHWTSWATCQVTPMLLWIRRHSKRSRVSQVAKSPWPVMHWSSTTILDKRWNFMSRTYHQYHLQDDMSHMTCNISKVQWIVQTFHKLKRSPTVVYYKDGQDHIVEHPQTYPPYPMAVSLVILMISFQACNSYFPYLSPHFIHNYIADICLSYQYSCSSSKIVLALFISLWSIFQWTCCQWWIWTVSIRYIWSYT